MKHKQIRLPLSLGRSSLKRIDDHLVTTKMSSLVDSVAETTGMRAGQAVYYLAFFFFCLNEAVCRTAFDNVLGLDIPTFTSLCNYLVIACFALKILFQRSTFSRGILALFLVALSVVCWRASGNTLVVWTVLFIVFGKDVEIRPLAAIAFVVYSLTVFLAVICCFSGIVEDITYLRGSSVGARSSLGFNHPNSFGKCLLEANLAYLTLRFGKINMYDLIVPLLSIGAMIFLVDTRTSAFALLVAAFLMFILQHSFAKRMGPSISLGISVAIIVASYYFMAAYNPGNTLHATLNEALSNRLYYANYFFTGWPLTLFGYDFADAPLHLRENQAAIHLIVDNTYSFTLVQFGLLTAFLLCVAVVLVFLKAKKEGCFNAALCGLAIMVVLGFSETWSVRFDANYFLVAFSTLLYSTPLSQLDPSATRSNANLSPIIPTTQVRDESLFNRFGPSYGKEIRLGGAWKPRGQFGLRGIGAGRLPAVQHRDVSLGTKSFRR